MFERILVPLDGSKLAERAIPHACYFARTFGGQLLLLQVLDSAPHADTPANMEPLNWQIYKAQAGLYLSGLAAQLREQGFTVQHALREGKVAESIVDYAHEEDINLLVISTHGADGLSRWNMSSVANKVISKAHLPILIVRAYQSTPTLPSEIAAQKGEAALYAKVLLPIDTSRRAECTLPAAQTLAKGGASLLLAAVVCPPSLPIAPPFPEEFQQLAARMMEISLSAVNQYLEEQKMRLAPGEVETRVLESENIPAAIHEIADQENVDLVILCAHGQTGGTHWPYGSVARNFIDHANKNVLIIQDIPFSQFRPTQAELAAQQQGRR